MTDTNKNKQNYEQSGVNIQAGDQLVDWLEKSQNLKSKMIVQGIGGYASLTRIPMDVYKKPLLVSCTDGVGTKALLAAQFKRVKGLGQDLVAMNVNDLICTGGDPYYFLDYWASGKLDLAMVQEFLTGVKEACEKSGCLLIGGETAEMPGLYKNNEFDCAGFASGFVDEDHVWGAHRVEVNSEIWALPSSGFHSNGYSLLRRVFEKDMDQWVEKLLTPTALYVDLVKKIKASGITVQAAAHITGSGFENITRVLPAKTKASLKSYPWPEMFIEVQKRTQMTEAEMYQTLNCGVGFVFVLNSENAKKLKALCLDLKETVWHLGAVTASQNQEPSYEWVSS